MLAGRPLSAQSTLVGTWRLVAMESRGPSGDVQYPMGRDVSGQLIYDSAGNVSLHLMRPGRPNFASGDRARGTDAETRAAFVGYLAYFGRYTVDTARRTVTHEITGSTFPNWVGTQQQRIYAIEGDRLTITTPSMRAAGTELTSVLVWERVR
jgi:hypothetical protein